mmetsp:Transcript_121037/g.342911  ORF Transcript_121037/g.342911 Transcript_121037/m.342911 type:complete len:217 (-) Transcript_121037:237-887(-)
MRLDLVCTREIFSKVPRSPVLLGPVRADVACNACTAVALCRHRLCRGDQPSPPGPNAAATAAGAAFGIPRLLASEEGHCHAQWARCLELCRESLHLRRWRAGPEQSLFAPPEGRRHAVSTRGSVPHPQRAQALQHPEAGDGQRSLLVPLQHLTSKLSVLLHRCLCSLELSLVLQAMPPRGEVAQGIPSAPALGTTGAGARRRRQLRQLVFGELLAV